MHRLRRGVVLDRLDLQAYRCFERESIALERLTLFVGANASGKSTILQALEQLARVPGWLAAPGNSGTHKLVDSRTAVRLAPLWAPRAFEITAHQGAQRWAIKGAVEGEVCRVETTPTWGSETYAEPQRPAPMHAMMLRFDPSKLGKSHVPTSERAGLSVDGTGLASAIADLALEQPDAKAQVEDQLQRIVPQVRGVRSRKRIVTATVAAESRYREHVQVEQTEFYLEANIANTGWVPASDLSEGTLLLLGLLTVLHAPSAPNLLLIDDLDRGLHPSAQRELAELLKQLLDQRPDLQIIATTHSPFLLDMVDDTQVRVLASDADGRARCRALSQHPDAERWRDQLRSGEFWSFVGESWVNEASG